MIVDSCFFLSQGVVQEPVFAFWLNRDLQGQGHGGEITFGGKDPNHYTGKITYVPLSAETYWQFEVDSVGVYGTKLSTRFQAIADSGTSLLAGPTEIINKIQVVALLTQIVMYTPSTYLLPSFETSDVVVVFWTHEEEDHCTPRMLHCEFFHGRVLKRQFNVAILSAEPGVL